jgi:hypothetical protein
MSILTASLNNQLKTDPAAFTFLKPVTEGQRTFAIDQKTFFR